MKDGGPAFPRPLSTGVIVRDGREAKIDCYPQAGMSLRQWYAGMALSKLALIDLMLNDELNLETVQKIVKIALTYADALLTEEEVR